MDSHVWRIAYYEIHFTIKPAYKHCIGTFNIP